jgi:hypothetical protein
MSFFVVVFLIIAATLAIAVYQWQRNQQRIDQLQQFCLAKGWQYAVSDDAYAVRWNCPPFFQGRNRRARDVITGVVGQGESARQFVAFDYSYVTDNNAGRNTSTETHRYAICAIELPTYMPGLCLTPQTAVGRLGDVLTGKDIELESEDFNRRFSVQCLDAKFASDVLPPRTMEALLAHRPLHFRIAGRDVMCWETGVTTPITLLERLAILQSFVDGIPAFVWHDYEPDRGAVTRPQPS